jgi:hypothetical protein
MGMLGDKQTVWKIASRQSYYIQYSDREVFRQSDNPEDWSSAHTHEVIASGQEGQNETR